MNYDKILLAHGSGGKLSHDLINEVFLPVFGNKTLNKLNDGALINVPGNRLVFSTDSFVVNPLFFEGGNIGKLAVCGTVNDLAMGGAKPLYLSVGFIIEEGFELEALKKILVSMQETADEAGIKIVTGDTKVVEKGSCDQIFINTAGIGVVESDITVSGGNAKSGDKIIINGYIGDHGMTVMAERQGLNFKDKLASDCAPLNGLVQSIFSVTRDVHVLRDPTRGGVATTLNEIAGQSKLGIQLDEEHLPVRDEVMAACEFLGFDPLYVANEGKVLVFVPGEKADEVLMEMKKHKYGMGSAIIGEVVNDHLGKVVLKTGIGGKRIVDMLVGEQLPRIC